MKRIIYFCLILLCCFLVSPAPAQNRTVLCELFTSTTCPPCVGANQGFDAWLSSYSKKNRVAVVKYHVWWPSPGNDPYYLANASQITTRNTYYGNNYAPHMFIEGVDAGSSYSGWGTAVETALSKTPVFGISITGTVKDNNASVTIGVTSGTTAIPTGTLKLHVVVTESGLLYTGTNGDPKHEHVMRKMVSDAAGETFTIAANETKSFERAFALNSTWKDSNCTIVAFIQVLETKSILQAGVRPVSDMLLNVSAESIVPHGFVLAQNYPNPFNPTTTIRYSIPSSARVKLTVHDLLGREIAVLVDKEQQAGWDEVQWDAGGFSSGIYYYTIQAGNVVQSKKMSIIK